MFRGIQIGFIYVILLISLAGVCLAADSPSYIAYIQGGESTIMNGSEGLMEITVKNVIPYSHISDGGKSRLIPVERIANFTSPLNTAIIFSGKNNESVSFIEVSQLIFSDNNHVLILKGIPKRYYDGNLLKFFADQNIDITMLQGENFNNTSVYFEVIGKPPVNDENIFLDFCKTECRHNPFYNDCLQECLDKMNKYSP